MTRYMLELALIDRDGNVRPKKVEVPASLVWDRDGSVALQKNGLWLDGNGEPVYASEPRRRTWMPPCSFIRLNVVD